MRFLSDKTFRACLAGRLLCALLALTAVSSVSAQTTLRALRWQEDKGAVLAVLELNARAEFHQFTLPAPPRLVIDFRAVRQTVGTISRPDEQVILTSSGDLPRVVERVRIGQNGNDTRVVFDLTERQRAQLNWVGNNLVVRFARSPQSPAASPKQPSGKKSFQEGQKHEAAQNWDLAAQEYSRAVAADPNNIEYRLHWLRTRQLASLIAAQRGDELATRADYAGAFAAYQQAFVADPTNELARTKMQRMTEQLQTPATVTNSSQPAFYPATGNVIATPADIRPTPSAKSRDLAHTIQFAAANLRQVIEVMAEYLELNVLFDESFRNDTNFRVKLNNVTMARALDLVLLQSHHLFEQVDRRTILIYGDNATNRQRYEQMMVKTFYLGNADLEQARTMLQAVAGGQHPVIPVKQLNALIVRDKLSNLRLYQELLDSIDKHRAEVVVDVNIYEVSRSTSLEIGNQVAASSLPVTQTRFDTNGNPVTVTTGNSASLSNLGGLGRAGIAAIAGTTVSPVLGGIGTLLGLPPSSLSLLQTKGHSRLLANTQVHALDGEQNQTKVGRSVPVRLGSTFVPGYATPAPTTGANPASAAVAGLLGGGFNSGFDSIQYRDVGLVIDVTPTISKEGYVQIKMKLESTSVEASGLDLNLTPSFSQRSLVTVARVLAGKTAVVAGIKQEARGDSRTGLPVIGMVPLLGRFFTAPRQTSSLSDIVITVTPHILHAPEIKKEDHLARLGGNQKSGLAPTIEAVVQAALDDEDQERRRRAPERQIEPGTRIVEASAPAQAEPRQTEAVKKLNNLNRPATTPASNPSLVTTVATPLTQPAAEKASLETVSPEKVNDTLEEMTVDTPQIPAVKLSLLPPATLPKVGESFVLTMMVNGDALLQGAEVALDFNPAVLQFKAAREGSLFGQRATLRQQADTGRLFLQLHPMAERAEGVIAQGELFLLEFTALASGPAKIEFNLNETRLRLEGENQVQLKTKTAQLTIIPK